MADPLSLLPLALAARGGRVDGVESRQLVAAGLTLLQRSAPLVRALSGRRSGILLPIGPALLTALAASDGRGAVLIDPGNSPSDVAEQLLLANVGAVFTTVGLARLLPGGIPLVLLDQAPRTAQLRIDGQQRDIDLGSHFGLDLEGVRDAEGLEEECVLFFDAGSSVAVVRTHREMIANARAATTDIGHLGALATMTATLMAGRDVTTAPLKLQLGDDL